MEKRLPEISDRQQKQTIAPKQDDMPQEDLTGRDRMVSNTLFSWAAHFVFIIAGFIMPRMIDRRLGQELLGIWDFAWALVTYFFFVQAGIGSSVNRFVARYQAAGDTLGMNRIVSSATCALGAAGLLAVGLTIAFSLLLPRLFGAKLGENILDAQWIVFFLGIGVAFEISFSVFGGIITGCHRWELHNFIKSGWRAATVAGMIVALLYGKGLKSLAIIYLFGLILDSAMRAVLAHRICEGLRLQISLVKWRTIKELIVFGGKSLIPSLSNMLLNQTTSILIIAFLGPAALALFTRPRVLIVHMNMLVNKMAMVLVPTVSSLQSTGNLKEIHELLIKSVRYSFYMALPMVVVLVVFGNSIMRLWMGPRYAKGLVPAILAVGSLVAMGQIPLHMILMGMNAHGRAGMGHLVASLCSVGLNLLVLRYLGVGLAGVAIAVTLPLTVMNMVYLPILIRRQLGISIGHYFLAVTIGPAVHVLPFAICLLIARLVFNTQPLIGLIWGCLVGGTILAILYWRYVIPARIKMRVFRFIGMRGSLA